MSKIALVTDTTCDLPNELIEKYNIHLLPFRILYTDREYRDRFEITAQEVYDNFSKEVPKSSLPSLQEIDGLFTNLKQEGYTHCIVITLSSKLSGVFNAIQLVAEDHSDLETFVFDSKSISMGEGTLVLECAKMIENNKSFEFIKETLPKIRERIQLYFVVGTLEYLIKGGRIGEVAGTIGQLLNLKPIIYVDEEGKYVTHTKVRGRKQSLRKIIEISEEKVASKPYDIYVLTGNAEEEGKELVEDIKLFNNVRTIQYYGNISPVAGVHSGPGLVGIAFIEDLSDLTK